MTENYLRISLNRYASRTQWFSGQTAWLLVAKDAGIFKQGIYLRNHSSIGEVHLHITPWLKKQETASLCVFKLPLEYFTGNLRTENPWHVHNECFMYYEVWASLYEKRIKYLESIAIPYPTVKEKKV